MEPTDISQDPKLKKYCRKLSPNSKKAIIKRFKHYYKATGLTPTQAIIEADQEEEDQIRLRRRKIITHLDELEEHLEGYSENTIKNTIGTIRSFYIRNYIQLPPRENTNHNTPQEDTTVEDLPGLNEIRKALSHSKPRTRAIIILMATSGMAQWEIRHLTFQDLIRAISKYAETTVKELCTLYVTSPEWTQKIGPLTWTITRQKTGRKYTTFSTPESFHEILIYLDSHPPLTDSVDEYLFRTRQGNHQIGERTFSQTFRRLNSSSTYSGCFFVTVMVTPSHSISAIHWSLSPHWSFNIFIISIGIIVLDDLPFVSACPIFVSYFKIIIPPLVFVIFNLLGSLIFNLIFYPISYPTTRLISKEVLCNSVRHLTSQKVRHLTKLCQLKEDCFFFKVLLFPLMAGGKTGKERKKEGIVYV